MNSKPSSFQFYNGVLLYPVGFVLLIWIVYWVEIRFGINFTPYGVKPQTALGLRGVLFSPFIHGSIAHLWHNTVPLFVLSTALFYFYHKIAWRVFFFLILLSGIGTWFIGRSAYHIGMSGVIYGLVSFLFFKGIRAKHFRLIALSLLVVFLYGSLVWGTLPVDEKISWEGHLAGLVSGALLGFCFRESVEKPPKYVWESEDYNEEDDPFMRQFDENGNFIEIVEEEKEEDVEESPIINYIYKEEDSTSETD
ncbi:rhomboid family intramembrane serine protease [uncultured Dokdonia sp.]|uniref:rhomboid family intramembrane serine protease n=1 Tax=uncultured Dokdonia sp. TaxID=575653 RepID=UPI0026323814|nr:rhomboid family intramembrane serine protease [uncultured Dokdonia sp.]